MKEGTPFLILDRVSIQYGTNTAVHDVSFAVHEREFVTLLGPSGSGKTSLLRAIAGFIKPSKGDIYLRGERVNETPPYERDIGMVFQNYALFPHMTVEENLAFGLRMRRVPRGLIGERVREGLEYVRMAGYNSRYPHELSGGQQQRVAVARAIVLRPSLFLLDEPMSNLDARLRASMQVELAELLDRVGITTLSVTHHQEEALSMSDRIVVMADGRIRQIGSPIEVYAQPSDEFVAHFLGESNLIRCEVIATDERHVTAKAGWNGALTLAGVRANKGESLSLLIRPEHISVEPGANSGVNRFVGQVRQVMYAGSFLIYWVNVGGSEIMVKKIADQTPLSQGSQVTVSWKPENIVRLAVAPPNATRA